MRENYSKVLLKYISPQAVDIIVDWVITHGIHLRITAERSTKLGDFRPNMHKNSGHRITINHNLNQHAFLITLVHEIAHLINWNIHRDTVKPHGAEWKNIFNEAIYGSNSLVCSHLNLKNIPECLQGCERSIAHLN